MVKKTLIGAGAAVALSLFLFGGSAFSFIRSAVTDARQAARDSVPLDYRLKEARQAVEQIVPDIRRSMHVIAEQQVELEHLWQDVARKEGNVKEQRTELFALNEAFKKGDQQYVFAGTSYSAEEVKRDLASRLARLKIAEESLNRDKEVLSAREEALRNNEMVLEEMLAKKQDLEVELERLVTRVQTEKTQVAASTLDIDDSQLAEAKKLIDELNKQLDVKARMRAAEGKLQNGIPVNARDIVSEDIASDVDSYLSGAGDEERQL